MWLRSNNLLDKLFRKNVSFLRLFSFLLFSIIGFYIILLASHLYLDLAPKLKDDSALWKGNYLIINKKVSAINTLTGKQNGFDEREINELKSQDFVKQLGVFRSSQFPVKLQISGVAGIRGFSTDLFLESIPNSFLEVDNERWQWKEDDDYIPIILPKNYLNLYNFGFASSQGLPQVSESLFKQIPFQLLLGKGENQQLYQAKIIDFTTKINTILVPDNFLEWANTHYRTDQKNKPSSRLIIETDALSGSEALPFLEQKEYDINRDELKNNEIMFYLKIGFSLVLLVGLLIVVASIWLLIINFQLIVEKNKEKLRDLHYIGYSPQQLIRPYLSYAIFSLLLTFAIALLAVWFSVGKIHAKLNELSINSGSNFVEVVLIGFGLTLLLLIINSLYLSYSIRKTIVS